MFTCLNCIVFSVNSELDITAFLNRYLKFWQNIDKSI